MFTSMLLFFVSLLSGQCLCSLALKVLGTSARFRGDPCKMHCGMSNVQVKDAVTIKGFTYCQKIGTEEACEKAYLWQAFNRNMSGGGTVKPCHWIDESCDTYKDERDWIHPCPTDPAAACVQTSGRLQNAWTEDEEVKTEEVEEAQSLSNIFGTSERVQGNEQLQSATELKKTLQDEHVQKVRKVKFVEVPVSTGAACLDGSPYVFAVTLGKSSLWTFHMDGRSCNTVESCARISETHYGSSMIKNEDYGTFSGCTCKNFKGYEFDDDCTCVDLPICDGGFFSGHHKEPTKTKEGKNLYFRGRRNFHAALDILFEEYGLTSAKDVITTGHSVGGTTSILTLDTMAALMPSGAKIRGMPTAGLTINDRSVCNPGEDSDDCTFDSPHVQGSDTCCYTKFLEQVYKLHNMSSYLSSDCLAAYKDRPWTCLLGAHAAAYTKTPMFILNSKYDAWQLVNILGLDRRSIYMKQAGAKELLDPVSDYGENFMKQLNQSLANTPHQAYITSCVCHAACGLDGSFFSNRFHDYWLGTLVATWFDGKYSFENNVLVDEDGPNYRCDASGRVQAVST